MNRPDKGEADKAVMQKLWGLGSKISKNDDKLLIYLLKTSTKSSAKITESKFRQILRFSHLI
ncbi:hypothetical protein BWD09_04360 [Neisseria dentiae]|uniref:Uncharacterized protein n=1 Tax=Neisseria dentiae TaxID=194197 RepID=A0A1X3DEC4_9NEIS|nr:hypothetical protein BWD09_04360 [Neisseria dentiae]